MASVETAAADLAAKSVVPLAVGAAAKMLREKLGLTVQQMAVTIGEEFPLIQKFETGAWAATEDLLEKYETAFNVNLHLYAVAFQVEISRLPAKIQGTVQKLKDLWSEEIDAAVATFRGATGQAQTAPAPVVAPPSGSGSSSSASSKSSGAALPDPGATSDSPHSDVPGAGAK